VLSIFYQGRHRRPGASYREVKRMIGKWSSVKGNDDV
jgi:hypothetical protein